MPKKRSLTRALVKKEKNTIHFPNYSIPNKSLNMNVRGLPLSATLKINEMSNVLKTNGTKIYKLGLGQSPFPVPESVVQSLRDNAFQKDYLPVKGLNALQMSISEYHRNEDQVYINPNNILIGPGSKELLFLLQLTFYGEILVPSPCWVSYIPQARIIGRNVKIIRTRFRNRYRLIPEQLDVMLEREHDIQKPRLLILTYPDNPTGASYSDYELKKIAEICAKYGVIVLSDEIYGRIHHKGKHVSIARYYPEGTIISTGISKWCGAGGWRLGCFSFPNELSWIMESMASVASETYTSVSAPIQYAATTAFNGNEEINNYLIHSRRILKALAKYSLEKFNCANIGVNKPDGGFYLFPNFEVIREQLNDMNIVTSTELVERILKDTGVAILPGEDFGRFEGELNARVAYVDFDGRAALNASMNESRPLNKSFLKEYCPNVITAIDNITDWVKAVH
jgi:aspartate aminotransferase